MYVRTVAGYVKHSFFTEHRIQYFRISGAAVCSTCESESEMMMSWSETDRQTGPCSLAYLTGGTLTGRAAVGVRWEMRRGGLATPAAMNGWRWKPRRIVPSHLEQLVQERQARPLLATLTRRTAVGVHWERHRGRLATSVAMGGQR